MDWVRLIGQLFLGYHAVLMMGVMMFGVIFKLRKHGLWVLIPGLVVYEFTPFFYRFFVGEEVWINPFTQLGWYNFSYIIWWAALMLIFWGSFKVSVSEVLFVGSAGYIFQNGTGALRNLFRGFLFGEQRNVAYYVFGFLLTACVAVGYYFLLIRRLKKGNAERMKNTFLVVFLLVTLLIINVFNTVLNAFGAGQGNPEAVAYFESVLMLICDTLLTVVQFGVFQRTQLEWENAVVGEMFRASEKQRVMSKQNIDIINRKCHDLKHQLAAIRAHGTSGAAQDKYFDEIERSVMIYDSIVKTGNESIDVVLSEKCLYCEENKIRLTYTFNGEDFAFMDPMDIYSLFGNALDNAIESVLKTTPDNRVINMRAVSQSGVLQLEIENYCEQMPQFVDGMPVTTKSDKDYHGFGVKSIRFVAEKYNGNVFFGQQGKMFQLRILFVIDEIGKE